MPAALLEGGLVVLAFAFAAVGAGLLLRQAIIGPLRGAASDVAGIAVIGGALAWALIQVALLVEIVVIGIEGFVNDAKHQAADAWNWLSYGTIVTQFQGEWNAIHLLQSVWGQVWSAVTTVPWLSSLITGTVAPQASYAYHTLIQHLSWVATSLLPWVNSISTGLDALQWSVNHELWPLVRGMGDDLAGLHRWIDANLVRRGELAQAQAATLARAQALVAPVAAAVTAIENSPCMHFCEPLGNVGSLLQGLEEAGILAILLGIIEETRRDPQSVQAGLRAVLIPIVRDAADSLKLGI